MIGTIGGSLALQTGDRKKFPFHHLQWKCEATIGMVNFIKKL